MDFPTVETEYGPVKGIKKTSVLSSEYFSFRGIPYMKAPLGKLRFREAEAPRIWTEPFDATEEGPSFFMTDFMTGVQDGQENAGTINVYTNNLKPKKLLPVMIWIHGGGYCRGSSRTDLYGPDYLMEKDVVFVSLNYRLGAIGFLSLNDPFLEIPGNVGLKDQVVALKWVQKNIEKFGGDPSQCTIFGESAGGSCVHFLTLTKQTQGLFQRAIIMSGSAYNKTWSLAARNHQAERLARLLGWKGMAGDEADILDFLEDVPAFEIDTASKQLMSEEDTIGYGLLVPFAPVVEPYISDNCILEKSPVEMGRETWSNDIDIIVMGTSFEGLLRAFVDEDKAAKLFQNPSYFAPLLDLGLKPNHEKAVELGLRIKKLYYKDGEEPSVENQEQYLQFQSDLHFWHGLARIIQSRVKYSKAKTYLMRFDVDGDLNIFRALKKCQHYKGACHADDIFYMFTTDFHEPPPNDSKEFKTIGKIIGMFTSFATTNDPNCEEVFQLKIKPCDETESLKCVNITLDDVAEIELPEAEKMRVWNSIYKAVAVPLY